MSCGQKALADDLADEQREKDRLRGEEIKKHIQSLSGYTIYDIFCDIHREICYLNSNATLNRNCFCVLDNIQDRINELRTASEDR